MNRRIISLLLTVVICFGMVSTGARPLATEMPEEASTETTVDVTTETQGETTEETQGETTEETQGETIEETQGETTEETQGETTEETQDTVPEETQGETPDVQFDFTASQECVEILKAEEGFRAKPYWDYVQYTVGYGTRCPSDKVAYYSKYGITRAEAEALLRTYLSQFEKAINNDLIKKYSLTLTQNQFDALLLFSYNCGAGWITSQDGTNIRNAVLSGATGSEMADRFSRWCNAGGEIKTYLLRRRLCEANIYLNGEYSQVIPQSLGYVLYDANGGSTPVSVQGFDTVQTAEIIPVPTRAGYTFVGWYTERTGGEKVTILDSNVRNVRLYARWSGSGSDLDDEPVDGVKVTVTTQVLTIRSGAGTGYSSVGSLVKGTQVTITETKEAGEYTWGKFSKGWICLKYTNYDQVVEDEKEEETPTPPKTQMGTIKVSSSLNVRTGPSTGYGIAGTLYNGDRVEILEQKIVGSMVWGKISNGWISMAYVELDPEEEPEPEKYSYTLIYHANFEGADPASVNDAENLTDSLETQIVFTVDANPFNREGYTFAGWATSADGEAVYQADSAVTLNKETVTVNLYAVWVENEPEPTEEETEPTVEETEPTEEETKPSVTEPETPEEPETKVWTGKVKVSSQLIVRSGPDTTYKAVTTLSNNAKVTIYEQVTTGKLTWGKIDSGWICMNYVVLDAAPEAPAEKIMGTVNVSSFLRIRSQAGYNYTIVGYLYPKDRVEILEKKTVGSTVWGKISSGWIDLSYVILDKQPTTPSEPQNVTKTVNTTCLRVRSQASTSSSITGYLYYGEKVTVTEQKTVNGTTWGKIATGWVCMDYLK